MSIFKGSLKKNIRDQIDLRQKAISNRTSPHMQYYNSRNAWIRMTSAVDVGGDKGALAKKHILHSGLISGTDGSLRSGIGNFSNTYSNVNHDGTVPYRLGIRPMPGITGLTVKTTAAYGSLREATVDFQCWDVHQLDELELLYLRPGYSAMVEWGWTPYLVSENNLEFNTQFIDDVLNGGVTKDQIWEKIYNKAVSTGGNYDAMYGFIKNYSWKARMDGGYDCSTIIMSTGEIIESAKINYISSDSNVGREGVFKSAAVQPKPFDPTSFAAKAYSQNIVAGVFSELYASINAVAGGSAASGSAVSGSQPK